MRLILISTLALASVLGSTGCSKPEMPSLTGVGKFHDLTQVRKGMSPNEVRRVMGTKYKEVLQEGLQGINGGNYVWEYPEGRVYFGMDGVTRTVPFTQ